MTNREMQSAFELEVVKHDSVEMIESVTIFYWLNEAVTRITKDRYNGINGQESFEQTQKRTDDLSTLVKEERLYLVPGIEGVNKPNSHVATLPSDYWYTVDEEVQAQFPDITNTTSENVRVGITECDHNSYSRKVSDPYSEHIMHYEKAKPLRLYKDNTVEVITDGNYQINFYYIRYIKKPITLSEFGTDCDLAEHMHSEVVQKAVDLYLQSVGDNRYQSHVQETNKNE